MASARGGAEAMRRKGDRFIRWTLPAQFYVAGQAGLPTREPR